ncbi:hypothetical protein jhhlp_007258 [Lomentospora prolificans]|uniref:Xylanolytic transcriptional activator regulatory domain-containing protein n=1 Tax=Lomentospora prolificans TaxID=41688 RepID=A0A2N3N259_9PEZI|nr:hypothetical protein jhhlp_007258 [Lomentospora prolificans]
MKAGRRCVVTARTRTGERQKKTDTRVAELEKKIDALTATLQSRAGPEAQVPTYDGGEGAPGAKRSLASTILSPHSGSATPHTRLRDWGVSKTTENPSAASGSYPSYAGAGQKRKITDILGVDAQASSQKKPPTAKEMSLGPDYTDVVERGVMTGEIADELFARYNEDMVPHLPGVVFPPTERAADLRKEKPLLFLAVMSAAAAAYPHMQRELIEELMEIFGRKIICNGEKSLEIVQALLVSVMWYFPPESFEELKFYQLAHIAIVMALDLGLGRSNPVKPRNANQPSGMHTLGFYSFRPGKDDPESLECRRTWLACYYLSSNTAMGLRRPFLLRWSTFMEDSVKHLEASPEAAPTDKFLCYLVRINKLGEDVSLRFSLDDPGLTSNIQEIGTQLALRGFEVELERLKRSIPEELMQPSMIFGFEYINIYMHESCLQGPHMDSFKACIATANLDDEMVNPRSLGRAQIDALLTCIAAVSTSFDTFLAMDISKIRCLPVFNFVRIAYALVILIKVNLAITAPESVLANVITDSLKAEYYLDSLLAKFLEASAEDKCRPAGKFLLVLAMLKGWFTNKASNMRKDNASNDKDSKGDGSDLQQTSGLGQTSVSRTATSKSAGADISPAMGHARGYTQNQEQPTPSMASYFGAATANTPLQLLSEVATGDPNPKYPQASTGWLNRARQTYTFNEGRGSMDMQGQAPWPPVPPMGGGMGFESIGDGMDWEGLALGLGVGLPVTETGILGMMTGEVNLQAPGMNTGVGMAMGGWNSMYQNQG